MCFEYAPTVDWQCIQDYPPSSIVRFALAQPKKNDDWRRTSIFQTLTKIGGKNCRVIIDSGSCVNAVASGMVTKLRLKTVLHPQPYKVSWVNSASIDVKNRCLIPILFVTYPDKIWCDVVTMDVGHHFRMTLVIGQRWHYLWTSQFMLIRLWGEED